LRYIPGVRHLRARRGTTSIEYGLIAMLVGIALIVAFSNLGGVVEVLYALTDAVRTAV
jgi:Flp pilus assembly pilin Flp